MDSIRRFSRPQLRRPRALIAYEGWSDACEAASGAVAALLGQHDAEPFALIEPEDFFDFQSRRPLVEVDDGGTRSLVWPATRFYDLEMDDADHDLVVVVGEEPSLRWKTYGRLVAQVLDEVGVESVVTLGAFVGQVAHTVPVPIIGVATDPDLIARHDLRTSHYEGPTSILSVILEACREIGVPALSLWAATPHYLAANPNPKAMLALVSKASEVIDLSIDVGELVTVASEFEARVAEAMDTSSDLAAYVKRLEESVERDVEDVSGERLIADIEQFLRNQG